MSHDRQLNSSQRSNTDITQVNFYATVYKYWLLIGVVQRSPRVTFHNFGALFSNVDRGKQSIFVSLYHEINATNMCRHPWCSNIEYVLICLILWSDQKIDAWCHMVHHVPREHGRRDFTFARNMTLHWQNWATLLFIFAHHMMRDGPITFSQFRCDTTIGCVTRTAWWKGLRGNMQWNVCSKQWKMSHVRQLKDMS